MPKLTIKPNEAAEFRLIDGNMIFAHVVQMSPRFGEKLKISDLESVESSVDFETPESLYQAIQALQGLHAEWVKSIRR